MAMALEKLKQMEGGRSNSAINQLFATHPDLSARTRRLADRAAKEGYLKPGEGGNLYLGAAR